MEYLRDLSQPNKSRPFLHRNQSTCSCWSTVCKSHLFAIATSQQSNKLYLKASKSPCATPLLVTVTSFNIGLYPLFLLPDEPSRTEMIVFEKQAFHAGAHINNSNIADDWLSTPDFVKRTDFLTVTEVNWYQTNKNNNATLDLIHNTAEFDCHVYRNPNEFFHYKKGKKVYFLSGTNYILTGPIIVACQWNTESQKDTTVRDFSELLLSPKKGQLWQGPINSLQSSPTGPAEQWAGGSRCRSLSSCKKHTNNWKTCTWKYVPLNTTMSKVRTQTDHIK